LKSVASVVDQVLADTQRVGVGLLVYSALLLGSALLLATSWVPPALIVAAAAVACVHASTGVAVVRSSVWQRAMIATSSGLHVALAVVWLSLLV
jgi:hypothetical protein